MVASFDVNKYDLRLKNSDQNLMPEATFKRTYLMFCTILTYHRFGLCVARLTPPQCYLGQSAFPPWP
jgi:hypothetical protein